MKTKASKTSKPRVHKTIGDFSFPFEEGGMFGTDPKQVTPEDLKLAREIVNAARYDDSKFTPLSAWTLIEAAKTLARDAMRKAGKLGGDWLKLADYMGKE